MSAAFDPYHKWLGIGPKDQPPTHYRLLGLDPFESDADVIAAAADQRMGHVKTYHMGPYAEVSQKLLNEISAARLCLLKPDRKQAYDASLRQRLEQSSIISSPPQQVVSMQAAPARRVMQATPLAGSPGPAANITSAPATVTVAASPTRKPRPRRTSWLPLGAFATVCIVGFSVVGVLLHQRNTRLAAEKKAAIEAQAARSAANLASTSSQVAAPSRSIDTDVRPVVPESHPQPAPAPVQPTIATPPRPASPPVAVGKTEPQVAIEPRLNPHVAVAARPLVAKQPIPDEAAQQEALRIIQDIFKDDFAAQNQDQLGLAQRLLRHGMDTKDDMAGRFMLLKLAGNMAAEVGDCDTALRAIDSIGDSFECDLVAMKSQVVIAASGHVAPPAQHTALARAATLLARESVKAEATETATQLAEIAMRSARLAKDRGLLEMAAACALECEDAEEQFKAVAPALEILKTDPENATAKAIVGRYRCFFLANWPKGLPFLAKADDQALRAAAKHELAQPARPDDCAKLADEWWDWSEREKGRAKRQVQAKAVAWYQMAVAGLQGLEKAKAELRIRAAAQDDRAYDEVFLARALERFGEDSADKAEGLVEEGLQLLASQKDKESLDRLLEAVKRNPESSEADFVIGMIYACVAKNPQMACRRYEACLRRDRTNGALLNNLAIAELQLGQVSDAVLHWKSALNACHDQEVGHNIGRLIQEVTQKRINVVGSSFDALKKSYDGLTATGEVRSHNPRQGWCLMLPTKADPNVQPMLSPQVAALLRQSLSLRVGSDFLEDKSCSRCRGSGQVECPVRTCARGGVLTTQRVAIGQNPASGDVLYQDKKVRVPCAECSGKGTVQCPLCRGAGKDPAL